MKTWRPKGLLAVHPEAFGMLLGDPRGTSIADHGNGVFSTRIFGPLEHHSDLFCDSYEAIMGRVESAISAGAKTVVLRIDSPGGLVSGCFETVNDLRTLAASKGVELVAYVDGQACSAAFALACAASRIYAPPAAIVGSIGVVEGMCSTAEADRAQGLDIRLVTSGAKKTFGHAAVAISDEAVADAQLRVNELAEIFFDVVASARGVSRDKVTSLEAGLLTGSSAKELGLVDELMSFAEMLSALTSPAIAPATDEGSMSEEKDDMASAVATLRKMAEEGDEKAKKMLAFYDEEGDKEEAKAESEEKPADEEKPDDAAAKAMVSARAAARVAAHGSDLEHRLAMLEAERDDERKVALFASRKDLAPGMVAQLATMPFAQAKAIVDAMPKPKAAKPAATVAVAATRGGDGVSQSPQAHELDVAMGFAAAPGGIRIDGNRQVLGVLTREQARAELARRAKTQGAR